MFTAPAKVGAESFFGVGSYESNVLKFSPAFGDTHTLVQESFRPPLRIRTHPLSKVFDQTFFKKFDGSRVSSPRVYTERCKYPVSALAERGCKSARDIGGQCHLYFKYAVTICTVRSFLQSFFFGLLLQRKSVKRFSGSKSVAFGNVMHSLREHDVTAKPS